MQITDTVHKKIYARLAELGLTPRKLIAELDMSERGFNQMVENHSMKLTILERTAQYLQVPVTYFLEDDTTPKVYLQNDEGLAQFLQEPNVHIDKIQALRILKKVTSILTEEL